MNIIEYVWVITLTPSKGDGHGGYPKQYAIANEDVTEREERIREITGKYTKSGNWTYTVARVRVV